MAELHSRILHLPLKLFINTHSSIQIRLFAPSQPSLLYSFSLTATMKTTTATILLINLISAALANPVAIRAQMCNKSPTASTSTSQVKPIASPTATTAEACQQQCNSNSACQSFVFGLPQSATAPECLLFNVAASQVPSQGSDLNVFDKACASSSVPTQAPTHDDPIGTNPSTSGNNNGNTNGNTNTNGNGKGKGKRASICGSKPTGPSTQSPTPIKTANNIDSQQACLTLCEQTNGCKS